MRVDNHVKIIEVAPRDGLQNERTELTTAQKQELVGRAVAYGVRNVEVTSFVHPRMVPAMADAEAVVAGLTPNSEVTHSTLILNERGFERALVAGIREVNYVVHCTETFSRRNQGTDIGGAIGAWEVIAARAADHGIRTAVTLAVAFGCPFEGEVDLSQFGSIVERVLEAAAPAELSLADTIGVAVPADVRERAVIASGMLPDGSALRAHFHNTRNTGIANALAALDAGIRVLDSSLGGIGGCPFAPRATGNISTEDLVYALDRSGFTHGLDTVVLADAGRWLEGLFGRPLPSMVLHAGGFPPINCPDEQR